MLTIATTSAEFLPADEFPDALLPHAFGGIVWIDRPATETAHPAAIRAGAWVCQHYRARAAESGFQAAARQLRKQGYPLEIALAVLTGRVQ